MVDVWCVVVVACFGDGRVLQWASSGFNFVQWACMCVLAGFCRSEVFRIFRLARKKCW
jgi:hypothetical protein